MLGYEGHQQLEDAQLPVILDRESISHGRFHASYLQMSVLTPP